MYPRRAYYEYDERDTILQTADILNKVLTTLSQFRADLLSTKDRIITIFGNNERDLSSVAQDLQLIFDGCSLCIDILEGDNTFVKTAQGFIDTLMSYGEDQLCDLVHRKKFLEELFLTFGKAESTINSLVIKASSMIILVAGNMMKGVKRKRAKEGAEGVKDVWDTLEQMGSGDL